MQENALFLVHLIFALFFFLLCKKSLQIRRSPLEIYSTSVGFSVAVLGRSQVDCGLRDHFATTVAHLLPKCITAEAFSFPFSPFRFPYTSVYYSGAEYSAF